MKRETQLNIDQKLPHKPEWRRYFAEYQFCIDFIFRSMIAGEITVISLPLAF